MAYNSSEAYDFSLFEPQIIEYPVKKPQQSTKRDAKRPQSGKKATSKKKTAPHKRTITREEAVGSSVSSKIKDFQTEVERDAKTTSFPEYGKKLLCFIVVCAILIVTYLVLNTKYDTLLNEISVVESEIQIQKGENVRLNAELSSMLSTDKVENYAENVLGMVKAENYQVSYIDLSEGDCVVVSGGKSADGGSDLGGKIKELFAYIF